MNRINFKFKDKEYILDSKITLEMMEKYLRLHNNNNSKELVKMIVCEYNMEIKEIIDLLNKKQLLYILNKFIVSNNIKYKRIYNYDEFFTFLEFYRKQNSESMKKVIEQTNRIIKNDIDRTMSGMKKAINEMNKIVNINLSSISKFNVEYIVPKFNVDLHLNSIKKMSEIVDASIPKFDIEKLIPKINFSELIDPSIGLKDTLSSLFENLDFKGLKESLDGYRVLLMELGYPYVDIDMKDIRYIYEQRDSENISEIIEDIIIKNYPEESINNMLEKWKEYKFIEKRYRILEQAIDSYNRGLHAVSIPVFFSQLEGSIADFFEHKNSMGGKTYNNYISEIFSKNESGIEMLNEVTKTYFSKFIFEKFVHGGEIPKFSRHAIMHGGDVSYATQINNLIIIIIFDTMLEYMNAINIES